MRPLTLVEFEQHIVATNKLADRRDQWLQVALFGLMGEAGGVLSALKKEEREPGAQENSMAILAEELGDTLWYWGSLCLFSGVSPATVAEHVCRDSSNKTVPAENESAINLAHVESAVRLLELERNWTLSDALLRLGQAVGALFQEQSLLENAKNPDHLPLLQIEKLLAAILKAIAAVSIRIPVHLSVVAARNIEKTLARWPTEMIHVGLFDEGMPAYEQLPRDITFDFHEVGDGERGQLLLQSSKLNIGDRLTDNSADPDFYRYHDVFHMAYAVHLGWSPVLRGLLRVKRKSDSRTDENEDGARAMLIEEGITTWIFNYAARRDYFVDKDSIDFSILKTVKQMVRGYEVDICPFWQWEQAILDGYRVFNLLKNNGGGAVRLNLVARSLEYVGGTQ
ncbi:NTP pyrophosphatase (non-canonical NTP hydrolase) [Paraburkholderia sp. HC6.4b]|uniref:nucleoside triphosphate pyrophosphohydrolase family protein n=1 Tax=unclassified Paraburkholderia TaxID=2615204 RepID=UPI00160A0C92|nr:MULTISPECIES: nucleoside triphosphate pyrophosphohydrolase family protein [unclassified Paraburkholderia]MBB5411038.1 NTP pyrophosphatase (non-canonical NTP hydrolase) [Paraburkholderia sp. HC6.4b]MBB5455154.1 NTP pyrophosphatase (non-canonical NTP hydrolase) [Paraburkholderia sp. Kb1A]